MASSDPLAKLFQALEEPKQEEKVFSEGELILVISKVIDEVTEYLRSNAESTTFQEKLKKGIGEKGEVKVTTPLLSINFQLAIRTNSEGEIRVRLESDYVINEKSEKVLGLYRKKKITNTHYISDVLLLTSKAGAKLTIEIVYRDYKKKSMLPFPNFFFY